jgi:hypothetical protein
MKCYNNIPFFSKDVWNDNRKGVSCRWQICFEIIKCCHSWTSIQKKGKILQIPLRQGGVHEASLQMVSNAFFKSMKAVKTFLLFYLYWSIMVFSVNMWSAVRLFSLKPIWFLLMIFNIIHSMYTDTICRIKFSNGLSAPFSSERGVKQVDVLNPYK